jgi:8-oxo-dGTP diphosphatase
MKLKIPLGIKRVAVFCILKCGNEFQLLKRKKPPHVGAFVPVGGKIDPYETPHVAVIREVKEETGINISNPLFIGTLIESAPIEYNWVSYVYVANINYVEAPYCDEGTLHWINIDEIKNLLTPPTDMYIYEKVLTGEPFALDALFDENMNMISMVDLLDHYYK